MTVMQDDTYPTIARLDRVAGGLLVMAAFWFGACVPAPVPKVRAVAIIVQTAAGRGVPGAGCTIQDTDGRPQVTTATDAGYALWTAVTTGLRDTQVHCTADGYLPASEHRTLKTAGNEDLAPLTLTPTFAPLPRLRVRGAFFELETGLRFTAIEASDFNLLARFIAGEDIEPILQQRADVGFNMLRVWTAFDVCPTGEGCQPVGRLVPREHADYYDQVPPFLRRAAQHGLYIELTAFAGRDSYDPQHWPRLIEAVRPETNVLIELFNENDQPANTLDPALFTRPSGVLASHGSNGSEAIPVRPWWDYETFHTNDAFEWVRKPGHNGMELSAGAERIAASHAPVIANENTRFPDRDSSLAHAYDAAASSALLIAGSCFHSVSGKRSTLWSGVELDAAKAWASGARSVDLACQDGPYVRRRDLETPDRLRSHERPVAGHDCVVGIRP